jgi:hypothetical protein
MWIGLRVGVGMSLERDANDAVFNFDQGSYSAFADVSTDVYRITPRLNTDSQWMWWAFRSSMFSGKTPHFLVSKAGRTFGDPGASEKVAFWGTDPLGDTWTAFDNQTVGASDIEFYNNTAFPAGTIYIASMPLYTYARSQARYAEWVADARSTALTIGTDTARDNGDGRTAPALSFMGLTVTNASGYTKNNLIVTARNHACETPGGYALEGFMTWLLGGSVEAEFLLDWFNVHIYPCLNPQGIWGGWSYRGPEIPTTQHNDTTAGWDDLDAMIASMNTVSGGDIEVGIDFHSGKTTGTSMAYVYNVAEALHVAFRDAYKVYDASFVLTADTTAVMLSKYWSDNFSAALSLNLEQCDASVRTITQHKTSGQYTGRTLAAMQAAGRFTNGAGVGSRDFNGTTNRIDWDNVFNTAGSAITVSAWIYADALSHNSYILATHVSGNTGPATVVLATTSGSIALNRVGSTLLAKGTAAGTFGTGGWKHILVTHDGVMTTHASVHIYIDNVEPLYDAGAANGAGETAATGKWSLGGRINDDARNLDGKLAQVGVWNRVVNSTERDNLAAGYAPSLISSGLQFYFKGNTNDLHESVANVLGTADGTTQITGVGNGPTVYYP